MKILKLIFLISTILAMTETAAGDDLGRKTSPIKHVIVISVDGLRGDVLSIHKADILPNFHRLLKGAGTLNARTDPDLTVTSPNHVSMVTGRFVDGEHGHGWRRNDTPEPSMTIHAWRGGYVASMFDVAHDHDVVTAMIVGKEKLVVLRESWGPNNGRADEIGRDTGFNKIDFFVRVRPSVEVTDAAMRYLGKHPQRSLSLVHYAVPDDAGHRDQWKLDVDCGYMVAVRDVDVQLGRLFELIDSDEHLHKHTAIILTSDHGGGDPPHNHQETLAPINYTIPFLVWLGEDGAGLDLYQMNKSTRANPGEKQPKRDEEGLGPIRNGDAANLALQLLGLPPVPDSTINAMQDLKVAKALRREEIEN